SRYRTRRTRRHGATRAARVAAGTTVARGAARRASGLEERTVVLAAGPQSGGRKQEAHWPRPPRPEAAHHGSICLCRLARSSRSRIAPIANGSPFQHRRYRASRPFGRVPEMPWHRGSGLAVPSLVITFRRLLVPVDFTETSDRALAYAL